MVPYLGDALRSWAKHSDTVAGWRRRRYELFVEACAVQPGEPILDVGCGFGSALERFNTDNPIVALDLQIRSSPWLDRPNVTVVEGDGTRLPFPDGAFPVVFSSSVVEHVPAALQARFAAEIRRVGDRYFVQTPNRWFPVEPHYQLPFFHFLPVPLQRAVNARVGAGWRPKGEWHETTLLSARELRRLFPDARIERERLLGSTKSLMAIRGPAATRRRTRPRAAEPADAAPARRPSTR